MKSAFGNFTKGVQIGTGFLITLIAGWATLAFGAAAWGALPNAWTTLSSSAWNDIVSQLNTLAWGITVTNGNVGIWAATAWGKLDVRQSSSNPLDPVIYLRSNSNNSSLTYYGNLLAWQTSPSVAVGDQALIFTNDSSATSYANGLVISAWSDKWGLKLMENGNVGIGTATPDAKLDVNGEMIRNLFYLEPTSVINQNYTWNAWTNLPGTWAFTYAKKSSTSKLLITINAVVRGNYSTSWWWTQMGMNINGTNWDFWGGYTNTTDMHTPGMYRRAISWIPKGTVNLQWTVYPSNTAWLCIGCTWVPNITIEEIY